MLASTTHYTFRICADGLVRVESRSGARLGAYRLPRGCTLDGFIRRWLDPSHITGRYRVGDLDY